MIFFPPGRNQWMSSLVCAVFIKPTGAFWSTFLDRSGSSRQQLVDRSLKTSLSEWGLKSLFNWRGWWNFSKAEAETKACPPLKQFWVPYHHEGITKGTKNKDFLHHSQVEETSLIFFLMDKKRGKKEKLK